MGRPADSPAHLPERDAILCGLWAGESRQRVAHANLDDVLLVRQASRGHGNGRRSDVREARIKKTAAILELLGELIRKRNQLRDAIDAEKRELPGAQLDRDELRVKLRRLEAERVVERPTTPGIS